MDQHEQRLFKNLCSFKSKDFDATLLNYASPEVLGQLFFNRMHGIAYGTLKKQNLLGKVNREFRNSLALAYNHNITKNQNFFWCVEYLQEALSTCDCNYAMLKGAYLCKLYPEAYRTSNDIDLLVHPNDLSKINKALTENSFKQGYIRNGTFEPATRKEIIEARMTRGETVPYIKELNLPTMKYLEIDINFSLDYKPGDLKTLSSMLERAHTRTVKDLKLKTLCYEDFFVHLCAHLYKEATTLPWIEMKRDMTLYKYCDIYTLLNEATETEIDHLLNHAKTIGMEKECAFSILETSELFLFENNYAVFKAKEILKSTPDFIHTVYSPKDKKTFVFDEKNIQNRFFSHQRITLLSESHY